jgi:hypothetical protein
MTRILAPAKAAEQVPVAPQRTPIGRVDDPLEHNADHIAEEVLRVPAPRRSPATKAPVPAQGSLKSPWQSLDTHSRRFFEPRFGRDFSGVRIHTDAFAAESARSIGALAYTVGSSIAFGAGQYQPTTRDGRRLIAHELAHVVQQATSGFPLTVRRQGGPPGAPSAGPASAVHAPVTFKNADLKRIYDAHSSSSTAEQTAALQSLDDARSGPWENLEWADVAKSTAKRVYNPKAINQSVLGVCAAAAVLNSTAGKNPRDYVNLVIEIFEKGTANGEDIKKNKTLLENAPPSGMDPSDWMVLSAMQHITNAVFSYYGQPPSPESQKKGEVEHGATALPEQTQEMLEKFGGCVKTDFYSCWIWGVHTESMKVNDLLRKYGDDVVVIMYVRVNILDDQYAKDRGSTHAPRLLKPMSYTDAEVNFDIYSWGKNISYKMQTGNFERMVLGYVVGARKNEISL